MYLKCLLSGLFVMYLSFAWIQTVISTEPPTYGVFNLRLNNFAPCKGPKRKDCSKVSSKILNSTNVDYDIIVFENMKPTKVKIVAMSNGKLLIRLQADDPCNHIFLRPVISSMLNVTDQCVVMKGHYVANVDLQKMARTYYHGAFVYGNLTFKSVFYNNQCNLSCTVVDVALLPKDVKN